MGMAASQARLLSITARMSNNEHSAQNVSYAKQRLADKSEQITNEYNEALNATKLTVLIGFDGTRANYEDISYNLMTGLQMATSMKQYVVTDMKNRILVTEEIADAYMYSRGNYNAFLAKLGYSQADLNVQSGKEKTEAEGEGEKTEQESPTVISARQQVHEAWDKYFETVGIQYGNDKHNKGFTWVETMVSPTDSSKAIGFGYTAYKQEDSDGNVKLQPINYEGSTQESKDLYDYAMALTEAFYRTSDNGAEVPFDMEAYKMASDLENTNALKYYKNIFNRIQVMGFITYTDSVSKSKENDSYIYSGTTVGTGKVAKNPLKDNSTFEAALRDGTLKLEYYSTTDRAFKTTTVSEDNCIQEVPDEKAIAKAEAKYTQDMTDLERQDKKFDMDLKRLDTEHNALQTEYESMKTIIDKNIENSFKTFS